MSYCDHNEVGRDTWDEYDARGIYLAKVCDKCVKEKLAGYRRDVLTDPSYEADEQIEPDMGVYRSDFGPEGML